MSLMEVCSRTLYSEEATTLKMSRSGRKYGGMSERKHGGESVWGHFLLSLEASAVQKAAEAGPFQERTSNRTEISRKLRSGS